MQQGVTGSTRTPNIAVDRTAGSHSRATAGRSRSVRRHEQSHAIVDRSLAALGATRMLIVPALSASLAAIGLLFTVYQSRRTTASAHSTRRRLPDRLRRGRRHSKRLLRDRYSEFKYDAAFPRSDIERQVDKLLRHFANIALAWQAGLLSAKDDYRPIQYYVRRVMDDPEIQKYLRFIASWSEMATRGEHPYAVLTTNDERAAR